MNEVIMNIFRSFLIVLLFSSLAFTLFGEGVEHETSIGVEFAYYFDDHSGYGQTGGFVAPNYNPVTDPQDYAPVPGDYANTELRTLGSGWGSVELQTYLKHRIKAPFLQGDGALVEDNNVNFKFDLYVAPVAAYVKAAAEITPIAFLKFDIGGMIGTGWNAVIFNGVGNNDEGFIKTSSFPGVVTELWSSATFQFDLAAIIPGEWTHVIMQINAKFVYSSFSTEEAKAGLPWQWLADSGENINGMEFKGSYFLGYQMPLFINTVGFLVETEQALGYDTDETMDSTGGWGSDFVKVTFGPLANFSFNEHNSLAVLVQFQTGKDYTDDTIFNQYYQNRDYEDTYVKFNRIALAYNYKF
jgi:hypothetical protein